MLPPHLPGVLHTLEPTLDNYGKIVVVARFIEGLRQANGIIAGITGMYWAKFLAFNAYVTRRLWKRRH